MRCVYCVLCVEMFICHNLFVVPHVNLISKATGACIEKRQALCNTLQRIASKHKDMYFCNVGAYLLANAGTTATLSLEDVMPDGSHWNKLGRSQIARFLDESLDVKT